MKRYFARHLVPLLLALALACNFPRLPSLPPLESSTPVASPATLAVESSPAEPPLTQSATPALPSPSIETPEATPEFVVDAIGPFTVFQPLPPVSEVLDIRAAPGGALWLVGEEALVSLDETGWTSHPYPAAGILGFDDAGRIWITPDEGQTVATSTGTAWQIYDASAGWTPPQDPVRGGQYRTIGESMVTDARGVLWLVTLREIRVFERGRWHALLPTEAGFTPSVEMVEMGFDFSLQDVALDSSGDVWVTDCAWGGPGPVGQGARWYNGSTWEGQASSVVATGCVADVEIDKQGNIWLGSDGVLWRFGAGSGWTEIAHPEPDLPEGLRWGWIRELTLEPDDNAIWVTVELCGGASRSTEHALLYRVVGDNWTLVSDAGPFNFAFTAQGAAWLCDAKGLSQVKDGMPTLIHADQDLACMLEADQSQRLWLIQLYRAGLRYLSP